MKLLISSFLFASIIFLIIDILWLSYSVKVFYRPQLGSLLLDKPILWAAIIFYLIYMLGLMIIIIQPALYYGNKPLSDYEKSIVLKNEFGEKTFQKMIEYSKNMNNCSLVLNFSNVLENSNENLYIDQVHINDVGHEIIAESIYEEIKPLINIKN